jgi:hypothetical protein
VRLVGTFEEEPIGPDGVDMGLPSDQLDSDARLLESSSHQTPDRASAVDHNLHLATFSPLAGGLEPGKELGVEPGESSVYAAI